MADNMLIPTLNIVSGPPAVRDSKQRPMYGYSMTITSNRLDVSL